MKKILTLGLVLSMLLSILSGMSVYAASSTDEAGDIYEGIPYSRINIEAWEGNTRLYPDSNPADDYAGSGKTMCVWNDFLFVPVYFGELTSKGVLATVQEQYPDVGVTAGAVNQLAVYDLSSGTPQLYAQWDMDELGMKLRDDGTGTRYEDAVTGVFVDDRYIYISMYSPETSSSYSNRYRSGVYVFENNIDRNNDTVAPPRGIEAPEVRESDIGYLETTDRAVSSFSAGTSTTEMTSIGDKLVVLYKQQSIASSDDKKDIYAVVDVSKPGEITGADVKRVQYRNILSYSSGSGREFPSMVSDAVFKGKHAFILAGDETDNVFILYVMDFTDPLSPVEVSRLVIDAGENFNRSAYVNVTGDYGYVTVASKNSGSPNYERTNPNMLHTVNLSDLENPELIASINMEDYLGDEANMEQVYETTSSNYTRNNGLGSIAVVGDYIVGIQPDEVYAWSYRVQLSEDRSEVYDASSKWTIHNEASAASLDTLAYGDKVYVASKTPRWIDAGGAVTGNGHGSGAVLSIYDFSNLSPLSVSVNHYAGETEAPFDLSGTVYGTPYVALDITKDGVEQNRVIIETEDYSSTQMPWTYTIEETGNYKIKVYASDGSDIYENSLENIEFELTELVVKELTTSAILRNEVAEGDVAVAVRISNKTTDPVEGIPVVVAYKKGQLVTAAVGEKATVSAGDENFDAGEITLTIPNERKDGYSDYEIKTFFWESMSSLKPQADTVLNYAVPPIDENADLQNIDWGIIRNHMQSDDSYLKGVTRQMSIWNDLLVVPAVFDTAATDDRNTVYIYDLLNSEMTETTKTDVKGTTNVNYKDTEMAVTAQWSMADLGIDDANTTLAGVYMTDEYIFVSVMKQTESGTKDMGVYVYTNNLNRSTLTAPSNGTYIALFNNNHATALSCNIFAMNTLQYDESGRIDVSTYNKDNKTFPITKNLIVEFGDSQLAHGENTVAVTLHNNSDTSQNFNCVTAVYEAGLIKNASVGVGRSVGGKESLSFQETITIPEDVDISKAQISVYAFESIDTIVPISEKAMPQKVYFDFKLAEKSATSAGVFSEEGKLIKTLWSNVTYEAGDYQESWDGTDDGGNMAPSGNYTVNVTSNNVSYEVLGIMGNNSDSTSRDTIMGGYGFINDMAFWEDAGRMYYTKGYSEGTYANQWFNTSNPHQKAGVIGVGNESVIYRNSSNKVATDGTYVYFASDEPDNKANVLDNTIAGNNVAFIYAHKCSDDSRVNFEHGQNICSPLFGSAVKNAYNAINIKFTGDPNVKNAISGLEVQKSGKFLFASYTNQNAVYVINKTTGETVEEHSFTRPRGIALDQNEKLWITSGEEGARKVERYSVKYDGSLTSDGAINHDFDDPVSLGVSPDGAYIVVVDGGDTNKLFVFDGQTLEFKYSYGTGESYLADPEVKEDKLLFKTAFRNNLSDIRDISFVEFEDNNTFWFADSGNNRAYKMVLGTASMRISDKITYMQSSYSCNVNLTDNTRVFSGGFEFEVNYDTISSESLGTYKYNYMPQLFGENINNIDGVFKNAATFPDGNVYAIMKKGDNSDSYLWKLDQKGQLSNTGILMGANTKNIEKDLSITELVDGSDFVVKTYPFEGVANGLPTWGEGTELCCIPSSVGGPKTGKWARWSIEKTDSGILAVQQPYSASGINASGEGVPEEGMFSLGGIDIQNGNTTEWKWLAAPVTNLSRKGDFPTDGYLELGRNVWYTTSKTHTLGNNIIYQYYGEGYGRVNKFTHFTDKGLLVGVYGLYINELSGNNKVIPGNGFSWNLIADPTNTDNAYIFQNDESWGGGVHISKISGLNTIFEQEIDVKLYNYLTSGFAYTLYDNPNFDESGIESFGQVETLGEIALNPNISVKYEGYFLAPSTKTHKFRVKTNGNVKVKLNGKTIINEAGTNKNVNAEMALEKGKSYKLTIWISPYNGVLSSAKILYNKNASIYQDVLYQYIYSAVPQVKYGYEYNLLAGLPYDTTLDNNAYGWISDGVAMQTNIYNYHREKDYDVSLTSSLVKTDSEVTVTKALPKAISGISSWTIDSQIMNVGYLNEADNSIGQTIDVLDVNGKIIARVYFGNDYIFYGNGRPIYQAKNTGKTSVGIFDDTEFSDYNELMISGIDGRVAITYSGSTVCADVYESGADLTKPSEIKVTQFNNSITSSTNFALAIAKLKYYME